MIAIHNSQSGFHPRWINYCKKNNIPFKLVDCYKSDIIDQTKDCDALMWHHIQSDPKDLLFAKQLLYSLEQAGMTVFPNFNTAWHFDDKVGQKYLLEAVDAPVVSSYVFYEKDKALRWIENTKFPKVFKLRGGAGSSNVRLVDNKREARWLVKKAFGSGFKQYNPYRNLKERIRKLRKGSGSILDVVKGTARFFYPPQFSIVKGRQRGYVYFQDFIPNNTYDIRVIVIGNKAFSFKRNVRRGDFRASGSGDFIYDKKELNENCVKIAFSANQKIKSQSIAFDFVFDKLKNPLIVEISYGFIKEVYDLCEGYWTSDIVWHEGTHFDFCGWMVENLIANSNLIK